MQMLSRSSSDARARLRRSQSTSTVHHRLPTAPELSDVHLRQQQALAAAQSAFDKARADEAAERYRAVDAELTRTKSSSSRKSQGSQQGSHFPPRESSFRSLKPSRFSQAPSVSRLPQASATVTERFPSFPNTGPSGQHHDWQPSSIAVNENVRPSSQPKFHRISFTSSADVHQIRKSRSLLYATTTQTGSPLPRIHTKSFRTPPPTALSASERAMPSGRRSEPVSSRLASPRLPVTVAPGETRDQARDKYLQDFRQRQVQKKPSIFLKPFVKRQDKGKEKAPSSSFTNASISGQHTSANITLQSRNSSSNSKTLKERRSFSHSIKLTIKRVFRKTSDTPTTLPSQQVEASRDYFNEHEILAEPSSSMTPTFEIPSPRDDQLQSLRSRTPSSDVELPVSARPGSRGSAHSLRSEASTSNSNSRATSWGSSIVGGTLTQRNIKRLTVIQESRDSISHFPQSAVPPSPERLPRPIPAISSTGVQLDLSTDGSGDDKTGRVHDVFAKVRKTASRILRDRHFHSEEPQPIPVVRATHRTRLSLDSQHSTSTQDSGACQTKGVLPALSDDIQKTASTILLEREPHPTAPPARRIIDGHRMQLSTSTDLSTDDEQSQHIHRVLSEENGKPASRFLLERLPANRASRLSPEMVKVASLALLERPPRRDNNVNDTATSVSNDDQSAKVNTPSPWQHVIAMSKANYSTSFGRPVKIPVASTMHNEVSSPSQKSIDSVRGAVRIPRSITTDSSTSNGSDRNLNMTDQSVGMIDSSMRQRDMLLEERHAEQATTPTPELIANRVEKSQEAWKAILDDNDNESPFSHHVYDTRVSISKLARKAIAHGSSKVNMTAADQLNPEKSRNRAIHSRNEDIVKPAQPRLPSGTSASPNFSRILSPASPSVYSRNEDGVSILPDNSMISLGGPEDGTSEAGTVVVSPPAKVRSFVISSPIPAEPTQRGRESAEFQAFVQKSVSAFDLQLHDDATDHPSQTKHLRDYTQIEEQNDSTPVIQGAVHLQSSDDEITPYLFTPYGDHFPARTVLTPDTNGFMHPPETPSHLGQMHTTARTTPDSVPSEPCSRSRLPISSSSGNRSLPARPPLSSIRTDSSSGSHSHRARQSPSEKMNDRYPMVHTGRRSSSNSGRLSQKSRSMPTSGSSSRKESPSSRIYSDFSHPIAEEASTNAANTGTRRMQGQANPRVARKENTSPLRSPLLLAKTMTRSTENFMSIPPYGSTDAKRGTSKLAQYITSAETEEYQQEDSSGVLQCIHPQKSSTRSGSKDVLSRPKSALETSIPSRSSPMSPPVDRTRSDSPRKRQRQQNLYNTERKHTASPVSERLTNKQLRSKPSWAANDIMNGQSSPYSGAVVQQDVLRGHPLHVKHSSSTLALNKEPSTGTAARSIDDLLSTGYVYPSPLENINSRVLTPSGFRTPTSEAHVHERNTPSHRLADSFINERAAGSGAGSPVNVVSLPASVDYNITGDRENEEHSRHEADYRHARRRGTDVQDGFGLDGTSDEYAIAEDSSIAFV